jgi:RND family efflux transporter MFP subunit
MTEAIDQGCTLIRPARASDPPAISLAHMELLRHIGGRLCTVPCVNAGAPFGAIMLERGADADFQPAATAAIEHAICLLAPVLDLLRVRAAPWQAIRDDWRSRVRAYLGRGRRVLLLQMLALALLGSALACPWPLRISAPAHIEGAVQRAVTAATAGYIAEAYVHPGDTVKSGQLLAVLDQRDLELERQRWQSELARHQNDYSASLAQANRATMVVAGTHMQEAQAQLALTEQRLDRARIRAPFAGLVIDGDLSRMLGAPVDRGQTLMTLAPLHDFRLMIEVDERDIERVALGARGAVALSARPEHPHAFEVVRITPVATDHDGRHFFTVEGRLAASADDLRPGQQGVAKIAAGERAVVTVLTRRLLAWLRLQAFALGW